VKHRVRASVSAQAPHPRIAELIAHWQGLAPGPNLLPGRQHFDPTAVPRLLPNIWLLEVGPPPSPRYRVRLIGGAVVEAGFPARPGEFIDEERFTADPTAIRLQLDGVVETRRYDWRRGQPNVHHSKYVDSLERVFLPLATDGTTVDTLLAMTVFYWNDGRVRG
jgi:hypothetical protein